MCIRDSFEGIALLFDHSEQSYVWAHNLVTLHYSDDLTDYPVLFQLWKPCLLYTSDAADERSSVDLGGRRIIKKKKKKEIDEH